MLGGATQKQFGNSFLRVHSRLLEGLIAAGVEDQYDYVLIDCPPNFNIVTKTAIVASSRILIPAVPDYLSTLGIGELRRHVRELTRDFNEFAMRAGQPAIAPSVMGVIPTMVQVYAGGPISAQIPFIDEIKRTGVSVFTPSSDETTQCMELRHSYGIPVVLQSVSGTTYANVRVELEELTTEFLIRL